jgi:hypothetical protein
MFMRSKLPDRILRPTSLSHTMMDLQQCAQSHWVGGGRRAVGAGWGVQPGWPARVPSQRRQQQAPAQQPAHPRMSASNLSSLQAMPPSTWASGWRSACGHDGALGACTLRRPPLTVSPRAARAAGAAPAGRIALHASAALFLTLQRVVLRCDFGLACQTGSSCEGSSTWGVPLCNPKAFFSALPHDFIDTAELMTGQLDGAMARAIAAARSRKPCLYTWRMWQRRLRDRRGAPAPWAASRHREGLRAAARARGRRRQQEGGGSPAHPCADWTTCTLSVTCLARALLAPCLPQASWQAMPPHHANPSGRIPPKVGLGVGLLPCFAMARC